MIEEANQKKVRNFIILVSIAVPALVTALYFLPKPESFTPEQMKNLYILPKLNATFNACVFLSLLGAFFAIKNKKVQLHKSLTTLAMTLSALFLISYVIFHSMAESTHYPEDANFRTFYLIILASHIILSALSLPFILITYARGLSMKVEKHRKIAKIVFPIWLYVALTGVIVYFMISPYYQY
ncbi:MAG: DUF420 domain-containing protein [Bacteroidota bacterium]